MQVNHKRTSLFYNYWKKQEQWSINTKFASTELRISSYPFLKNKNIWMEGLRYAASLQRNIIDLNRKIVQLTWKLNLAKMQNGD